MPFRVYFTKDTQEERTEKWRRVGLYLTSFATAQAFEEILQGQDTPKSGSRNIERLNTEWRTEAGRIKAGIR